MPLYKIIKAWVLPPGIFILMLLLITIYLLTLEVKNQNFSKKQYSNKVVSLKFAYLFSIILSGFIYILSINAISQRAMRSLEYAYAITDSKTADAIYVLGGADVRARAAALLHKQTGSVVVVSGYNGEAEGMRKILLNRGVPSSKIITESKAINTIENAKYMLPIAINNGYKKIYLVTSAYHMPRSMMNFKNLYNKNGIEILPYPCGYTVSKEHNYSKPQWLPKMSNLWYSTKALDEYLGMLELMIVK